MAPTAKQSARPRNTPNQARPTRQVPPKALIGMVHVRALPGTPHANLSIHEIVRIATQEADLLARSGFDAIIIENMHDRPYVHGSHGPQTTAALTRVACEIRQHLPQMPLGIQVLSGGNKEALAIALAADAQFIRCENFVYAHVADEGLLTRAEAGGLLRFRRSIGAEHIEVWCDIKKKHASHAITGDLTIGEIAEGAEFFSADALIVTGSATGQPTDLRDVDRVRKATPGMRTVVGSGVSTQTIAATLERADGVIVGSQLKRGGLWSNPLEESRCRGMVKAARDGQTKGARVQ